MCEKNKTTKEIVQRRIARIVLTYDPENKINSALGDKNYDISLDNSRNLTITVNLQVFVT